MNRQEGEFDFQDVFFYFRVYFSAQPWLGDSGPPTLLGSNFDGNFPDIDFSKEIAVNFNE